MRPYYYLRMANLTAEVGRDSIRLQALIKPFLGQTWKQVIKHVVARPGRMPEKVRRLLNPSGPSANPADPLTGRARRAAARTLPEVEAWRAGYRELGQLLRKYGAGFMLTPFKESWADVPMPGLTGGVIPVAAYRTRGVITTGHGEAARLQVLNSTAMQRIKHPEGIKTRGVPGADTLEDRSEGNSTKMDREDGRRMDRPDEPGNNGELDAGGEFGLTDDKPNYFAYAAGALILVAALVLVVLLAKTLGGKSNAA
jgi:hypothetical protein